MAFNNNSLTTHLEDLRSRNPQSPPTETSYTPSRYSGSFMPSHSQSLADTRGGLQRRSTTDSGKMPTITPIGHQPSQAVGDPGEIPITVSIHNSLTTQYVFAVLSFSRCSLQCFRPECHCDADFSFTQTLHKVQAVSYNHKFDPSPILSSSSFVLLSDSTQFDKKRMDYEKLREQRAKFEAELNLFNMQQLREKHELEQMAQELQCVQISSGHQSEPTTPPEHRDQGFQSVFGRRNRFSTSSIASPPGLVNRSSRSGSQLTSPPSELMQTPRKNVVVDKLPSKSVPGSRRGSDGKDRVYMPEMPTANQRVVAYVSFSYCF